MDSGVFTREFIQPPEFIPTNNVYTSDKEQKFSFSVLK